MASVWVARQRGKHGFEKLVAIKTILPRYASDPRFQRMFLDEARIASGIEHVNVAQIFDLGEENDILYLVMEYVEGDALSKLHRACQRKGIAVPTQVTLRILADACRGLHEAHQLRDTRGAPLDIVHRDVSPHNILISTRGMAKCIDFGIAKARSRMASDTNTGVLKGKVQYMSPEQALARTVDRRADVWAVGAVLYHLVAGRPPYDADGPVAALALLRSGRPPAPLPRGVPAPIAAVIRTALAHSPDERYATAAHLHEAIEQATAQTGLPATNADVATFVTQHLGERIDRRRRDIDDALAEAAERSRARGLSEARVLALLSSAPVAVPAPNRPSQAPPQVMSPLSPLGSGSFATLGSAALDAGPTSRVRPSRKPLFVVSGVTAVAAVLGLTFALRAQPASRVAVAGAARARMVIPLASSELARANPVRVAPVLPLPSASSLPETSPPPEMMWRAWPPLPSPPTLARAATQATAETVLLKSHTVDDGF
jgi:serine/threonine-protein kinase